MAQQDTVRVIYEDGLVLGADELMDDQRYLRAALERRSLARDLPGVAYGLELQQDGDDGPIAVGSGVAYCGNGKVVVLRDEHSITQYLDYGRLNANFPNQSRVGLDVFLAYRESEERGNAVPALCGQAQDPRVVESFEIWVEEIGSGKQFGRLRPQDELAGDGGGREFPVRLGCIDVEILDVQQRVAATVKLAKRSAHCSQQESEGSPLGAQFIGARVEGLIHPRRFSDAGIGVDFSPALRLDPEEGIELREPTHVLSNLLLHTEGALTAANLRFDADELKLDYCDGTNAHPVFAVGQDRMKIELPIDGGAADFERLTVADLQGIQNLEATSAKFETLDVSQRVTLRGAADDPPDPFLTVIGGVEVEGALTLRPTTVVDPPPPSLDVTGDAVFKDAARFEAGASFLGVVGVGSIPAPGELNVHGSLKVSQGTLDVLGDVRIGDNQTAAGLSVTGPVQVAGVSTLDRTTVARLTATQGLTTLGDTEIRNELGFLVTSHGVTERRAVEAFASGVRLPVGAGSPALVGVAISEGQGRARVVFSGPVTAEVVQNGIGAGGWLTSDDEGRLTDQNVTLDNRIAKALEAGVGPRLVVVV